MSIAAPEVVKLRTYGGFHKPKGFGLLWFGPVGTAVVAVAAFGLIPMLLIAGIIPGVIYMALVGGGLALGIRKDRHGKTQLDKITASWGGRRQRRRGGEGYRPGVLTPVGGHKLPGVLAASKLYSYTTDDGQGASFIHYPGAGLYATSMSCEPDGAFGLDPEGLNAQVDSFADWLAGLAHEPDLKQLAITVETAPDGGAGLELEVNSYGSDRASDLSRAVMSSVTKVYPAGSSEVSVTSTLTFSQPKPERNPDGTKHKAKKDGPEAIGHRLSTVLPHLMEEMPDTGAGAVTPLSAQDVSQIVRVAYNPDDRKFFDQIEARGDDAPDLRWDFVGPTSDTPKPGFYGHSGAVSMTWEASGFTSHEVLAKALLPLLQPHKDVATKRVTFLYKPIDPAKAAVIAETNHRAAQGRVINSKKPSAREQQAVAHAERARDKEAQGAALVNFAVLVTATVPQGDEKKARSAIEHVGPTARLHLRLMEHSQPSAFAQALGVLGLITDNELAVPTALQNGL
jgi:hypothetical protein